MNKKIKFGLISLSSLGTFALPLVSTISCGSKEKNDLFIFTGKAENIDEFRKGAALFSKAYKDAFGKSINIKIAAVGNGVDSNQNLAALMQRRSGKPDVITSFGIADVKKYADAGSLLPIDNDQDLAWSKNALTNSMDNDIAELITQDMSLPVPQTGDTVNLTDKKQWGIPINVEAVGMVVNLKTLGAFVKTVTANNLKIGQEESSGSMSGGILLKKDVTQSMTDIDAGKQALKNIYQNGWNRAEFHKVLDAFQSGSSKKAIALTGMKKEGWIHGFHEVPNWLSQRMGARTLENGIQSDSLNPGFRNTYATMVKDGKDLFNVKGTKSIWDQMTKQKYTGNQSSFTYADANNKDESKDIVKSIYEDYYKNTYLWSANDVSSKSPVDTFTPFGDGTSLMTHASTGMYGWIAKNSDATVNDIAPIPIPLNTGVDTSIPDSGDLYNDVTVSAGMLWHFINTGNSSREKLAKHFIEFVMTGKTKLTVDNKTETLDNIDAPKEFFNSDNSQLFNPYSEDATGSDFTSKYIKDAIAGVKAEDILVDNITKDKTPEVSLWTNGALSDWGGKVLGSEILGPGQTNNAGKQNYSVNTNAQYWDKFKERLYSKV